MVMFLLGLMLSTIFSVNAHEEGHSTFSWAPSILPWSSSAPATARTAVESVSHAQFLPTSSISGFAFFDSHGNGVRDASTSAGIEAASVSLLTCATNEIINSMKTDPSGYYSFDGIDGGQQYYISSMPSEWYAFSDVWNGETDETGALLHPEVDSAINPETGSTSCFDLVEGEDKTVSFGLEINTRSNLASARSGFRLALSESESSSPPNSVLIDAPVASAVAMSAPIQQSFHRRMMSDDDLDVGPMTSEPSTSPAPAAIVSPTVSPSSNTAPASTADPSNALPLSNEPSIAPTSSAMVAATSSPSITTSPTADDLIVSSSRLPSSTPSSLYTVSPSNYPTATNADISSTPSVTSFSEPSPNLTSASSFQTSEMPSGLPTRLGDLHGPTTTEGLVMAIHGMEVLEDEAAWSTATSNYIMSYFNLTNDDPGVFDVTVSIEVTNQMSSNDTLFQRHRRQNDQQYPLQQQRPYPWQNGKQKRRRRLHAGAGLEYVEVTYSQTSSYKTSNPANYDDVYVATKPFLSQQGSDEYFAALHDLSPHYEDASSVWSTRAVADPPLPRIAEARSYSSEIKEIEDTSKPTNIGAILVVSILVGALVFFVMKAKKDQEESFQSVGHNGPPSDKQGIDVDLEKGQHHQQQQQRYSPQSDPSSYRIIRRTPGSRIVDSVSDINEITSFNIAKINVIAPAGNLGIITEAAPTGGLPYICEIMDSCPVLRQIQLEDEIIAVDDEDVREMTGIDLGKLLASKSEQPERKITILREVGSHGYGARAVSGDPSSSNILPSVRNPTIRSDHLLEIIAPPGNVGIVLLNAQEPPGPPYVFNVRDDSPLAGKIRVRDTVVAVDGVDARNMAANEVSKFLSTRHRNSERKITVLRAVDNGGVDGRAVLAHDGTLSADGNTFGTSFDIINIIAPAGRLGLIIDSPLGGGSAHVTDIKEHCLIKNEIHLLDKVVAIDDEDVSTRDSIEITKLLASKIRQEERKITVWREKAARDGSLPANKSSPSPFTEENTIRTSFDIINIIAPAGKLGLIIDSPPEGGVAHIIDIKEHCSIKKEIRLWDKVVAIDDEDVSRREAVEISKLLANKSMQGKRKITVSREKAVRDGILSDGGSSPSPFSEENTIGTSFEAIDIIAPAGKLGLIIDSSPEGGMACVIDVKEHCPIKNEIHLWDKVVAIDDEDVSRRKAVEISKLLASKSGQEKRKLTVWREKGNTVAPDRFSSSLTNARNKTTGVILSSPQTECMVNSCKQNPDTIALAGVVIDTEGEAEYARFINHLDDKGIADDEEVSKRKAAEISMSLPSKVVQREKQITFSPELDSRGVSGSENKSWSPSSEAKHDAIIRSETKIDIIAPAGKLDVAIGSSPEHGAAPYVSDVMDSTAVGGNMSSLSQDTKTRSVKGASTSSQGKSDTIVSSETIIDIVAPAGKLGVVIDSLPEGGPAYVSEIKEDSRIKGEVHLGDKVIAIDGDDVSRMKAVHISLLLAKKKKQGMRKITVLRDVGAEHTVARQSSMAPINLYPITSVRTFDSYDGSSETKIDIIVPAGKLGLIIDSLPEGGPAYVSEISEESPLSGKIHLGDKVVAIDGEKVSKMKAVDISMFLASKSGARERKITVLRETINDDLNYGDVKTSAVFDWFSGLKSSIG